jgi:hypothetical protein
LNLSETFESTIFRCTIMDEDDSQGLLKTVLGFFARKQPESSAQPASLRSRTRDAWLRTDAYLQHDTDGFGEIDPERLTRTLRALEDYVQYDSHRESDSVSAPDIRQAPVFQPLTSCLLTQGYGAELTPRCGVSKASGGAQHGRTSES